MSSTEGKPSRWPWLAGAAALVVMPVAYVVVYRPAWIEGKLGLADDHASQDDHEEHELSVNVTVWTDEVEIYVNHPYAVATESFEMAVHITQLKTVAPLVEGSVTTELAGPGGVHEATAAVADPGVSLVPLQLAEAGEYQVRLRVTSSEIDGGEHRFELPTLTVYETEDAAHQAAEAATSQTAVEVEFLKEQQWRIGLRTEVLQPREIAESLVFPGKVVAPHGAEAMIVPPIPGRVIPPPSAEFPLIGDAVTEGQSLAVIEPSVAGRDIGSVVADIRQRLADNIPLGKGPYAGYYVELGGQFESAQSTFRLLLILGCGVVLAVGLLLHIAFQSARDAILVLLSLPMALIGGVFGVFISGGVFSIASLVGFITLLGIATRNGIMLVAHIRHVQREEGEMVFRRAVHRGAMERLAPILMTALSTGLGLLPLALGGGKPGSEIETPLAIVVLFGLLSSTLLNMAVMPAVFLRWAEPVPPTGLECDRV